MIVKSSIQVLDYLLVIQALINHLNACIKTLCGKEKVMLEKIILS